MSTSFYEVNSLALTADFEIQDSQVASSARNKERLDRLFRQRVCVAALSAIAVAGVTLEFVSPKTTNAPIKSILGNIGLMHEVGPLHKHYVKPGESLWSIASSISKTNTGQVVYDIETANHLNTETLVPDQELEVPSSDN